MPEHGGATESSEVRCRPREPARVELRRAADDPEARRVEVEARRVEVDACRSPSSRGRDVSPRGR